MSSDLEWQQSTWKGTSTASKLAAVQKSAHRKMAQPIGDDVGNLVKTLTEVKSSLRAEQAAYLDNVKAVRKSSSTKAGSNSAKRGPVRTPKRGEIDKSFPLKWGMNPVSAAVAPAPETAGISSTATTPLAATPLAADQDKPVEVQLLGYIEKKQAALEASKAELQRSLAATRDMERRFDDERRRLQEMDERERFRLKQRERLEFNPFQPDAAIMAEEKRAKLDAKEVDRFPHKLDWRLSPQENSISQTPQSHPAPAVAEAIKATSSAKGKEYPAGKSHRHSYHPNHPASFAPPASTEPIDPVEAIHAIPANKKTILDLFRNYDVNCTGSVNTNEFSTGLIQAGLNLSLPQVTSLIKTLDRDNKGEIRYVNLIETSEEKFQGAQQRGDVPDRWFKPPPIPQEPAVYVPIPPFGSQDPVVQEALKRRGKQSSALAILRTQDRTMRMNDGSIRTTGPIMPEYFNAQTDPNFAPSGKDYFPRPPGFVEQPYKYSLGPTTIISNPTAHPHDYRSSNSSEWGVVNPTNGSRDPQPTSGEFGRDYSAATMDPHSVAGASFKSISERVSHNPVRFVAMMRSLDLDRDQRVTHREFLTGLERLGVNIPSWRIRNLLQQVDRHGTGSVKYEEVAGLLNYYSKEEKKSIEERAAEEQRVTGMAQVNPLTTPGFVPSIKIPLHSQPTWEPSIGQGNNVDKFTEARRIEREWAARVEREKEEKQMEDVRAAQLAERAQMQEAKEKERQEMEGPVETWAQTRQKQQPQQPHSEAAEHYYDSYNARDEYHQQQHDEQQSQYSQQPQQQYSEVSSPVTPPTPISHSPRQQSQAASAVPTSPRYAHYPTQNLTTEQRERLEALGEPHSQPHPAPPMEPIDNQLYPLTPHELQLQEGTQLPVLEIEYPPAAGIRSRTPAPKRSRSRSNSISSVRSQTPSHKRGGEHDGNLVNSSFREAAASTSSRNGSRRGSFSQASRGAESLGNLKHFFYDNDAGKFLRLKMQPPTPRAALQARMQRSQWTGEAAAPADVQGESRGRSRAGSASSSAARRSASVSAVTSSAAQAERAAALAVEDMGSSRDAELFKIMKLSIAPPLSRKARESLSRSATPNPESQQQYQQQYQEEEKQNNSNSISTPSRSRSRSSFDFEASSGARTPGGTRRDIGSSATYGLNYGAWSDRRARDYFGSGWTLG